MIYQELIIRTSAKLSTDLTEDEVRQVLAELMEIPVEQVPIPDLAQSKVSMREQAQRVENIIADCKSVLNSNPKTRPDKFEELNDVGKFVDSTKQPINIEPQNDKPFPDFILRFKDQYLGLEHTRLLNPAKKATTKSIKYFFAKAGELIRAQWGQLSKTVNIFIDVDEEVVPGFTFRKRQFPKNSHNVIAKTIADYVVSQLTNGDIPKPNFISRITISANKDFRVDLELAEKYFTETDITNDLLAVINKKEEHAEAYRNVGGFSRLWLLIVIDDINSYCGFKIKQEDLPKINKSSFDAILLFEKFDAVSYRIYPNL